MCIIEIHGMKQGQNQANEDLQPWTKPVERHYKNTYSLHLPWQKCSLSQIKRPFPPSPIAMLFTVTEEIHTWAVKPKQHCTRGGEGRRVGGANLFLLDTMVTWREIQVKTALKCLNTFVRDVDYFCGGSEKSRFQWLHKEQFQNFLELYVRGRIYCFFNKFLILLGNRSRSESMRHFKCTLNQKDLF